MSIFAKPLISVVYKLVPCQGMALITCALSPQDSCYGGCAMHLLGHLIPLSAPFRSVSDALSLSPEASALDLTERLGAAHKCHCSDGANDRQGLEQVPSSVVKEEDKFHGNDGAKECRMGQRSGADSLADVIGVGAKDNPLTERENESAFKKLGRIALYHAVYGINLRQ